MLEPKIQNIVFLSIALVDLMLIVLPLVSQNIGKLRSSAWYISLMKKSSLNAVSIRIKPELLRVPTLLFVHPEFLVTLELLL